MNGFRETPSQWNIVNTKVAIIGYILKGFILVYGPQSRSYKYSNYLTESQIASNFFTDSVAINLPTNSQPHVVNYLAVMITKRGQRKWLSVGCYN